MENLSGLSVSNSSGSIDDFDYSFALKKAPLDSEGYVISFSPSQLNEAKDFFSEYGFMVIRDALSPKQCEDSINDIWEYVEKEKWKPSLAPRNFGVKRDDISTWNFEKGWPSALSSEGILAGPPVFTKQALLNRMNLVLYDIGKLFYESDDVIVSHDRYGLFRSVIDEKTKEKYVKFMTDYNVHIDMNPWSFFDPSKLGNKEYSCNYSRNDDFVQEFNATGNVNDKIQVKLQALYNFLDNKEEDGGFHVIPGMHNRIKEWTKFTSKTFGSSYRKTSIDFIPLFWKSSFGLKEPADKETFKGIGKFTQRVTSKAGSLIVWSQFLPHGSAPNFSNNIRMAQFLKIGLASQIEKFSRIRRAKYVQEKIEKAEIKIEDEKQKKLMGVDILI